MAYIGNTVQNQGFAPAVDYFNGDGTTVTFTLSRPVASVAQLTAVIDNVIQNPSSAFTVSGSAITFTSAPLAGTNNIWVEYTSLVTTYAAISQDPSVIGDITASGGYLAVGDFGNTYIDGTIVDYVTGNARITTGPADGLTIYNGGTSARTALASWDTSGNLTNTGALVTPTMTSPTISSGPLTIGTTALGQGNASIMKNRIINGAMMISQYNGTSSSTPVGDGYFIDRYRTVFTGSSKFTTAQNLNSVTPPTGFINYAGLQVATAGSISAGDINAILQSVEGFNISDLGWGTANAKTVTLSFQVYSNITGTFGGSLSNSAFNRSYPFTYSIPVANTWTTISVTIAGDTAGTWLTTNGIGIRVYFSLGTGTTYSGTAGAWAGSGFISATGATSIMASTSNVFYLTGVQLEVGSSATGFEYRQYGTELNLCYRYYWRITGGYGIPSIGTGMCLSATGARVTIQNPVQMRTGPSYSYGGNLYMLQNNANGILITSIGAVYAGLNSSMLQFGIGSSSVTQGDATLICIDNSTSYYFDGSAEL